MARRPVRGGKAPIELVVRRGIERQTARSGANPALVRCHRAAVAGDSPASALARVAANSGWAVRRVRVRPARVARAVPGVWARPVETGGYISVTGGGDA